MKLIKEIYYEPPIPLGDGEFNDSGEVYITGTNEELKEYRHENFVMVFTVLGRTVPVVSAEYSFNLGRCACCKDLFGEKCTKVRIYEVGR